MYLIHFLVIQARPLVSSFQNLGIQWLPYQVVCVPYLFIFYFNQEILISNIFKDVCCRFAYGVITNDIRGEWGESSSPQVTRMRWWAIQLDLETRTRKQIKEGTIPSYWYLTWLHCHQAKGWAYDKLIVVIVMQRWFVQHLIAQGFA